jgi:hypothetical protein
LFYSGVGRSVTVFRVCGKFLEQAAGKVRAQAAVKISFFLTADSEPAFSIERVSIRGYATAASGCFFVGAGCTDKAAP